MIGEFKVEKGLHESNVENLLLFVVPVSSESSMEKDLMSAMNVGKIFTA